MYKPIKNLSTRHRRRLRQQILKQIKSASPFSVRKTTVPPEPNQTNPLPSSSSIPNFSENIFQQISSFADVLSSDFEFKDKCSDTSDTSDMETLTTHCLCSECDSSEVELITDLRKWTVNCNVSSQLLNILKNHKINVPGDARTLLQTPKKVEVVKVAPGEYCHLGIENSILKNLNACPKTVKVPSILKIYVNVDGLPLSKSSGSQFWPILGWFCS